MMDTEYQERKLVSDTATLQCHKALAALKRGWMSEFEACLNELERLYHYANTCPNTEGFGILLHCMRGFVTDHLLKTNEGQRGLPGLYSKEDQDPDTGRCGHWWCETCQSTKSALQVSYSENCTKCGNLVVWVEDPED